MHRSLVLIAGVLAVSPGFAEPSPETAALIDEGGRLVRNVGLCADCHSPRHPDGTFVQAQWLQGSPLPFAPTVPMPWAPFAPGIAGLPTMTDEQAVAFLTSGERPSGIRPLPPMPEYRFAPAEAKAVVAYLRSLPAGNVVAAAGN